MERNGASYVAEPEIMGDEAAWKVGRIESLLFRLVKMAMIIRCLMITITKLMVVR